MNINYKNYLVIFASFSFLISNSNFHIKNNNGDRLELGVNNVIEKIDNLKNQLNSNKISFDETILPSYSSFYQIEDGVDIDVSYTSEGFVFIDFLDDISKNKIIDNVNSKRQYFPEENLVISDYMIFRGLVVKQITFYPFRINLSTGELEAIENVNISIDEYQTQIYRDYKQQKKSRLFEEFYEDLIVNYESNGRSDEYQTPSILYICGGSSINNSYVQNLFEWRHKSGYIVNYVSTDEIGSSSSSIKSYIQNAYDNWENPPEIVGLIGDTGGSYSIGYYTESWSGYGGAGDLPYTQLDGTDLLPEILIGRISVNSNSDLNNVINKTIAYEKATYLSQIGTDWYERAALCGDPSSSGQSTIITNQYIENIMNQYGFEDINTNYGSGNYSTWMENELEEGCLYMNYRGYYGSSGFGAGNINSANNYYKTPFTTFLTCGTGDYNSTSLSEDFFRAGSVSNPKGAVASIGTATTGTHTMFNNIVGMGIYDGIFSKKMQLVGSVVANAKLSLLNTYPDNPSDRVSIFSFWNNLIGDPALLLWTDTPETMYLDHYENISYGTNFIEINVTNNNGLPVEDVLITLLKGDDEVFLSKYTDNDGFVSFDLDYDSFGEVFVTAIKQNYIPIENSFNIENNDNVVINVSHENITIDDSFSQTTYGNDDGILNPGEIVSLTIPLINYSQEIAYNVEAQLSSQLNSVDIMSISNINNQINPGEIENVSFWLELDNNVIDNEDLLLRLDILDDSGNSWESNLNLDVHGGFIVFDHFELVDNAELSPGIESDVKIYLLNVGNLDLNDVQLNLLHSGYSIDIIQSVADFGDILVGEVSGSFINARVLIDSNTINGSIINMHASIMSEEGYNQDIYFPLNIGEANTNDPLGPDLHGYYIYDSNDLGYNLCPIYDWIEIDEDYGGSGSVLPMSDGGNGNGISSSSYTMDLPFSFKFYGIQYNQITINTNGWITFGESNITSFRNYPIPGAGGPSPMVAAFWDDLKTSSNAEIYKYESEHYLVIQWSEMRTQNNNSVETFQMILYDDTYLTPTGDNEIKIQYKEFNNTSTGSYDGWGTPLHGAYCTVGIENHLSDDGLQYTFSNQYPQSSMILSDETAIFITTRNPIQTLSGDPNQDEEINILDVIVTVNHIINVEQLDSMGIYIADVDGNGNVNILDVILIINLILNS